MVSLTTILQLLSCMRGARCVHWVGARRAVHLASVREYTLAYQRRGQSPSIRAAQVHRGAFHSRLRTTCAGTWAWAGNWPGRGGQPVRGSFLELWEVWWGTPSRGRPPPIRCTMYTIDRGSDKTSYKVPSSSCLSLQSRAAKRIFSIHMPIHVCSSSLVSPAKVS